MHFPWCAQKKETQRKPQCHTAQKRNEIQRESTYIKCHAFQLTASKNEVTQQHRRLLHTRHASASTRVQVAVYLISCGGNLASRRSPRFAASLSGVSCHCIQAISSNSLQVASPVHVVKML
jgi:hypothetical protein